MIGKTRTNVRAEIDTQYEILSQMIEDIANHYQEEELRFEKFVDRMAEEDSEGDEAIIEVFEDFEGHGKKTDIIRFDCSNYGPKRGVIYVNRITNGVEEIWEIHRYC